MDLIATTLDGLATKIEAEHQAAYGAARTALEHAAECGRLLIEAKAEVGHGNWLPWLEANTSVSVRQSQKYMRLANGWKEIEGKCDPSSHLTLTDAVALLGEPKEQPSWREFLWRTMSPEDWIAGCRKWGDWLDPAILCLNALGVEPAAIAAELHYPIERIELTLSPMPPLPSLEFEDHDNLRAGFVAAVGEWWIGARGSAALVAQGWLELHGDEVEARDLEREHRRDHTASRRALERREKSFDPLSAATLSLAALIWCREVWGCEELRQFSLGFRLGWAANIIEPPDMSDEEPEQPKKRVAVQREMRAAEVLITVAAHRRQADQGKMGQAVPREPAWRHQRARSSPPQAVP